MSVSLRVTGTWAELINDGAVAIPATPQAGDRMYLFARWKDFSITAQVTSPIAWTELAEFADGAVTATNGAGSVKVACWYRDWESGDTNPTIDFSAAVENASVVIMVMQKGADDVWDTPLARTAAMTNWTTTSQIVSASATAVVPSGGVVMGLIGIRDDSAAMTRPTSGIDDSAAAVTWNGDYVESPATHHSTTTGFDGATDLGYRLVSVGATATLRMTGTISAAETGAALWIVQGVTIVVTPGSATLTLTTSAPELKSSVIPAAASLAITSFSPTLKTIVVAAAASLSLSMFAPTIVSSVVPASASLTISAFAPTLFSSVTPATANLTITGFSPLLVNAVTPASQTLTIGTFAPSLASAVIPATLNLSISTFVPSVWPAGLVFLDPGGDAVQAAGYFNTDIDTTGLITFDSTQEVVGVGSYKFDSDDGSVPVPARVAGVLAAAAGQVLPVARRLSTYFRYDSVPDATVTVAEFVGAGTAWSGGGFDDPSSGLIGDEEVYATATPAQNAGQGTVFTLQSQLDIPIGAVIDSVKIIYERKYDTQSSIGISRVKYRIDFDDGPDHDNTEQPLTDTVVTVDVTADRGWTWQDLTSEVFEVIAEARRGNTSTPHTQSWDYVKVEVVYHLPNAILGTPIPNTFPAMPFGWQIALTPKGSAAVLRFVDGAGVSYDGITQLDIDTWYRISLGYVYRDVDDLDMKLYVNGIEELSVVGASTGEVSLLTNPHLHYGWLITPGIDHRCWFDQLYIDDGDDLSDCGNKLMTAKLSAAVNENNWNTTGGTGAVNERPLSETNYIKETEGIARVRQSYTLQTAATGDVDVSGETLVGHMGWAWATVSGTGEPVDLILNNVLIDRTAAFSTGGVPLLLTAAVASASYPSHAAGIGMRNAPELLDTFMYECGAIVAYEGPVVPSDLLDFQLLAEDSTTDASDDMGGTPPDSYVLRSQIDEVTDSVVTTTIYSSDEEGGSPQQQVIIESHGGGDTGITNLSPGNEVTTSTLVTGADASVELRRVDQTLAE